MASDRSDHSTLHEERTSSNEDRTENGKQRRDEKANRDGQERQQSSDDQQLEKDGERDQDGVRIEKGVPMVGLKGDDDPLSPLNMSKARKWMIVLIISSGSVCVTCCSSVAPFTYMALEREFPGTPQLVATLTLSMFVVGLGLSPALVGPVSEFIGRQPVYLASFVLFIVFNLMCAFANNMACLIIGRFLAGMSGAAFLSVGGGSVSDLFAPNEVPLPMAVYSASPFLGPEFGPLISGFINQHLDWRWTYRILTCWAGGELLMIAFLVPETYLPAILRMRARKLRKAGRTGVKAPLDLDERSFTRVIIMSCARPFQILALEPMALVLCTWTALLLGIIYLFFGAFEFVFGTRGYGFNMQCTGLAFLGIALGTVLGTMTHPIWQYYSKKRSEREGRPNPPEETLRKGIAGGLLVPAGLFWFAFTTYRSVHWIVPIIATIPFGMGVVLVYQAVFTYLVVAYRPVAASAMAANSILRSTFAAAFPLATNRMFTDLGNQWAIATTAFLTLAMAPFPFLFFRAGDRFRKNSKFSSMNQ